MASGARFRTDPVQEMRRRVEQAKSEIESIENVWRANANRLLGKFGVEDVSGGGAALAKEAFDEATSYATEVLSQAIEEALNTAVSSSVWAWSTGGARDIVDTGALRDSLSITVNGDDIDISYGVPYASLVHNGGYIRPYGNANIAAVYLPGRPWIDATLYGNGPVPSVDLDQVVGNAFDSRLR